MCFLSSTLFWSARKPGQLDSKARQCLTHRANRWNKHYKKSCKIKLKIARHRQDCTLRTCTERINSVPESGRQACSNSGSLQGVWWETTKGDHAADRGAGSLLISVCWWWQRQATTNVGKCKIVCTSSTHTVEVQETGVPSYLDPSKGGQRSTDSSQTTTVVVAPDPVTARLDTSTNLEQLSDNNWWQLAVILVLAGIDRNYNSRTEFKERELGHTSKTLKLWALPSILIRVLLPNAVASVHSQHQIHGPEAKRDTGRDNKTGTTIHSTYWSK